MNIKPCHYDTFAKTAAELEESMTAVLADSLCEAVAEEAAISVEKGSVDGNGIPCLTVLIDGAWNKRSYGHGYTASSGAGVIIGAESRKILYVGTRNKRCKACSCGSSNHACYKNWAGPSGAMEADIMVEGFNSALERDNVKFTKVVGDEDSSVYRKLKDEVLYGHQLEKHNCVNHARKNFKKALIKLEESSSYLPVHRRILTKHREFMVKHLRKVLRYSGSIGGIDVPGLKVDIKNIAKHVFRDHSLCRNVVCEYAGATDHVLPAFAEFAESTLYVALKDLLYELSLKANRLRLNFITNNAESAFSCLNKYNRGKRVDLAARGEFHRRTLATALNWNDHQWLAKWYRKTVGQDPGL